MRGVPWFVLLLVPWMASGSTGVLAFGNSVDDLAVPGAMQTHGVTAAAGTVLRLRLDHGHLDAVLRVRGPEGTVLGQVENLLHRTDPLSLTVVAQHDGTQRVEVELRSPHARGGPFRLSLEAARASGPEDGVRIQAEELRKDADVIQDARTVAAYPKAVADYRDAAERWRELGDSFERSVTLRHLGQLLEMTNRLDEAQTVIEDGVAEARRAGDAAGESEGLNGLGLVVTEQGNPRAGLALLEQALALQRQVGPLPIAECSILNDMAVALGNLGEFQAAIDRYTEALAQGRLDGDADTEAQVLLNRAVDYGSLGDDQRALADFREARAKFRALADAHEEGVADFDIGRTLGKLEQSIEAWRYLEMALDLLTRVGDQRFASFTLNEMGLDQLEAHRYDEATALFSQALEKLSAGGDQRSVANMRMNLARTMLERGRAHEALEPLEAVVKALETVGDRGHEAGALTLLARAELAEGLLDRAREHALQALRLTEELRSSILGPSARSKYVALAHNRYALLVEVLMALHARDPAHGWDAEALAASETARGRSLLDVLTDARVDTRDDAPPALTKAAVALDGQLDETRAAQVRLLAGPHRAEDADALERKLETLRSEREALEAKMRASSPRFANLAPAAPLDLEQIRRRVLDDSTTLIEYFLGERHSFVWVVSPSSLISATLPGRHEVEQAVEAVYRRWSDPSALDDGGAPARALARMVLTPVAAALRTERILVVADGALQQIPFAALPLTGSGRLVVAKYSVVNAPSASVMAALRERPHGNSTEGLALAILADPVLENDARSGKPPVEVASLFRSLEDTGLRQLEPLPGTRVEAEAIAAHFPPGRVLKAYGADASRATALGSDVARAHIVHFATHALLDVRRPELSGIVLSARDAAGQPQDGFLSLADLYRLHLSAELVVLSACRTALGKNVRGEGLVGLTRAFMDAGAPRVVSSLWKVSDRATTALMTRFYSLLLDDGLSPADALRGAQRSLRESRQFSAPQAWAGFVFQGDWRRFAPAGAMSGPGN
jgi:CHAT domain-containing protein